MSSWTLEIPTESPCPSCQEVVAIELDQCPHCQGNTYRLTFDTFFANLEQKLILDGRYGGLVLGRDGPEDDIPMYRYSTNNVFNLAGLMQGGEYLMCEEATIAHREELIELNAERGLAPDLEMPTTPITTINTNLGPRYAGLWISTNQFIINRYATATYLQRLEELNTTARQAHLSQQAECEET